MSGWHKKAGIGKFTPLLVLALVLMACQQTPAPAPTVGSPEPTQAPSASVPAPTPDPSPSAAGPCMITGADASTAASTRPSLQADAFGSLVDTGFPIRVMAQTADGWWGFDPGVAQAANTGVFRNRWVQASQVQVEGDCAAVPVVAGPMPGVCFTMPMADTPVYAGTDTSSSVLITLVVDQYAAVLGTTSNGWAQVDLSQGNSGSAQTGWVTSNTLNFNGPCENLPALNP